MEETRRIKLDFPLAEQDSMAKAQTRTLPKRLFDGKALLLMHTMAEMGELRRQTRKSCPPGSRRSGGEA